MNAFHNFHPGFLKHVLCALTPPEYHGKVAHEVFAVSVDEIAEPTPIAIPQSAEDVMFPAGLVVIDRAALHHALTRLTPQNTILFLSW
jgi:hypothetical protein